GALHPRRSGDSERHRKSRLRRTRTASCNLEAEKAGAGGPCRSWQATGKVLVSAGVQPASIPWTPAPAQLQMAYSVCRGITRTAAKNFYYAFLVLPKRKREALCAVYAFMRRCDDITDDSSLSLADRRVKLDRWLD